jgi:hypothetical protein
MAEQVKRAFKYRFYPTGEQRRIPMYSPRPL